MKDNTNNKEFWNNYVSYWERKVDEANHDNNAADKTVDDKLLLKFYDRLEVTCDEKILDYGCGSGRLYALYRQKNEMRVQGYYGLDVSGVCLEYAAHRYPELQLKENLIEFDGINIPFPENSFDKIMCFSVFDAVRQEKVLSELLRVLKPGGRCLITGKNSRYFADDEEAYVAEVNARKKEHPNSFTNVKEMEKQLIGHGAEIYETCYFLKRRDFALDQYVTQRPDTFYQWALVLGKTKNYQNVPYAPFSDRFSETFKRMQ